MLTRAIIKSINSSQSEAELYVPLYANHSDIPGLSSYYKATISTPVGIKPQYRVGDVVYVSTENNDPSKLVIIGTLYRPKVKSDNVSDAIHGSIKVSVDAQLPSDTWIGLVSPKNIKTLKNCRSNIQDQLDSNVRQKIELLDFMSEEISKFLSI